MKHERERVWILVTIYSLILVASGVIARSLFRSNSFNAGTSIQYQLPQARRVTLKIFNFLGQRVMTLGDEFQSPGYYTAYWDGKDENGNSVSSGVYIYQLVVDGVKTVRRKMMLLK